MVELCNIRVNILQLNYSILFYSILFYSILLQTIDAVKPDIVMVELCNSRVNILQLDEETLLEEAKNINMEKVRSAIRQVIFRQVW